MDAQTQGVKINVSELTQSDFDTASRILASSVRRFFEKPGIREKYYEWLMSDDAKNFIKT